jgi:hypothetical protein
MVGILFSVLLSSHTLFLYMCCIFHRYLVTISTVITKIVLSVVHQYTSEPQCTAMPSI